MSPLVKSDREPPAAGDAHELGVTVQRLTENTKVIQLSLDELREVMLHATRQLLASMEDISRKAKLRTLSYRWFNEPLVVQFPPLGVDMENPSTCAEFVASPRIIMAEDAANLEHFGTADPKAVLTALDTQFESAISGQVAPQILIEAAIVLSIFKADSENLASHFAPVTAQRDDTIHASYLADAKAAEQCQAIIIDLAQELGISLSTKDDDRTHG